MKKPLILFLLLFTMCTMYSQDLIVTNNADSLNCKITKIKADYIYFTFNHKGEIRNTLLPLSEVKTHQKNYYSTSLLPNGGVKPTDNFTHFRLALHGGYSYLVAKVGDNVPSDFQDYIKELKSGYHFGGDISYYFTENLGFGIKYSQFKSSNSISVYSEGIEGNVSYGEMSDNITTSFIGPMFSVRIQNKNKKNAFILNTGFGYMGYSNDSRVILDNYTITGSTIGMIIDIGYDIGLSEQLSLGGQISLVSATLTKYKLTYGNTVETIDLNEDQNESLSRIDLSIGIRLKI